MPLIGWSLQNSSVMVDRLSVVQCSNCSVVNATESGTGVLIADKDAFDAGVTSEKFAARDAGADGNNLSVVSRRQRSRLHHQQKPVMV